jgi:uncharacterized damage-inducible protein DinB
MSHHARRTIAYFPLIPFPERSMSASSTSTPAAAADLRYPIGRMPRTATLSPEQRTAAIESIALTPERLRAAVRGLSDSQLDTPYRPEGWTVRQLVHHVADSHTQAYARTKFALAENDVTITPYDEAAWAELPDMRKMPVEVSLDLLDALHARWVYVLRQTPAASFARSIQHPENGRMTVDDLLGVYQWHGKHHTAHVTALRDRMGWS